MYLKAKTLRYYYWLILEFFKKNLKLILFSFLISLIFIIGFVSITPYLSNFFLSKKMVIGLVGNYNYSNLPDEITSKISNGLVFINDKGEIVPALSSSWEILDNGKLYRFQLKNNLLWNNGKNFSSNQLTYKFKEIEIKTFYNSIVEFRLKKPLAIFPTYLTKPIIEYPLVGVAGLYKVDYYKLKFGSFKEIHLVPNKKNLPLIVYKFFDTETKLINAYKLGEISQMTVNKKSVVDFLAGWKNTQIIKEIDYGRLLTIFFNIDKTSFKEKALRQAISMAIDRQNLVKYGLLANSSIPPTSWAYNPNLKNIVYNPDIADKTIKKSQIATNSAKLTINTSYEYLDITNEIANYLDKVGIKTNIKIMSSNNPGDFDMLLVFFKVPTDPDQYYFWHSTQSQGNITNYKNLKIDKLLEDGRDSLSSENRKKYYYEFQKVMADDLPAIFLYYPYIYTIKRK